MNDPASLRIHIMIAAQQARADGLHHFARGLLEFGEIVAPAERPNYGNATIDPAAFANVEAPTVSPTLDR